MATAVGVRSLPRRPVVFWLDVAVKLALVALLLFAVARPDLPQFHGKAVVGNWAFLVTGFGRLLVRLSLGRLNAFALAVGFGYVTAVLWEFGEYLTFIRNNKNELRTAYTDTLGDLALGGGGSVLAALLTVTLLWPHREAAVGAS